MKIPVIDVTPQRTGEDLNPNWWTEEKDVHAHAWSVARKLAQLQESRKSDNLRHARLYSNRAYMKLSPQAQVTRPRVEQARLTLNVIKSCIDTASSKISQSRPRPMFVTSGGDYKLKRKAKQLTKFMDGLFDAANVYAIGQMVFRDSCVFGLGIAKVFNDGESVCFERVLPDDFIVDDAEAAYGSPRQAHQRNFMNREQLAQQFPKQAENIRTAAAAFSTEDADNPSLIAVVESWHLSSTSTSKDGRRVVSISNATLVDEPYESDRFPFAILRWSEELMGFYGIGLAEELFGVQVEINKILRNIQSAQNLCSVPRVFLETSTQVNGASLQPNPEGLSVVRYSGQAPTFLTASAMPSEVYTHLDRLERKAYEITGVSQLSAQSKKPSGLDSGVALREFQDIESERFVLVGQRYEEFFLDLARLAVEQAQELYEAKPDLNVMVAVKGSAEKIKWKEVNLKRDQYVLRCFPTSLLPTTPAGRLQKIQELTQAGFIGKEEAISLLDFPDLERSMSLNTSAYEDAMIIVEKIMEDSVYTTPEPYMNLELCIKVGQSMYLHARADGAEEDKLELLRRFIDDCNELIKAKQPSLPPQLPAAPQAVPEPLPQSDMLPQAAEAPLLSMNE